MSRCIGGERMNNRERNTEARIQIAKVSKNLGVRYSFIAEQMEVDAANFNHWRGKRYEYGLDKLDKLEVIIEKYNIND